MSEDMPKTMSVPAAGARYFNLARNASYAAAARGEIPVIRIGSRLRVPTVALERMLMEAGTIPVSAAGRSIHSPIDEAAPAPSRTVGPREMQRGKVRPCERG